MFFERTSNSLVIVCTLNVEHCRCRGLAKALILMHVFPSSAVSPKKGCHFALLDSLHLAKMYAHVSNHAFANMYNHEMLIMKDYQSGVMLNKDETGTRFRLLIAI